MDVSIRQARSCDCIPLLALIQDHAKFERNEATIREPELARILEMRNPPSRILVAIGEAEILAYAAVTTDWSLWTATTWAHLDCLYVKPDVRSNGVGAALLHYVLEISRHLGADKVEWQTPDWNERAIAFYNREGASGIAKMRFSVDTSSVIK